MDKLKLAEFPTRSLEDWRALADPLLGPKSSRTGDGLDVKPLYNGVADAEIISGARQAAPWQIIQRIDHPNPGQANSQALDDLENGATGLTLTLAGSPFARGYGVQIDRYEDLTQLLDNIELDGIETRLEAGGASLGTAAFMIGLARQRGCDLGRLKLSLGLDPIGTFAVRGLFPEDYSKVGARLADIAAYLHARDFGGLIAVADGRHWHNAGGSQIQELGAILGAGVQYLRDMAHADVPLEWAVQRIGAVVSADADEFMSLAKIRALRLLWRHLLKACGLPDLALNIHSETSWRAMSRHSAHNNMLRATLGVTSAGLGGADSICVLPFTSAAGLPDASARRSARNTQIMLIEESHLARVMDPAAGSGAVEAVTENLARRAWKLFQEIEKDGGITARITNQKLQNDIRATRDRHLRSVAELDTHLTGVSVYADLAEPPAKVLDAPHAEAPATSTPVELPPPAAGEQFEAMIKAGLDGASAMALTATGRAEPLKLEPLTPLRFGEAFETLRMRSDVAFTSTGKRPGIFLATLGRPDQFNDRAGQARNLFEAGGIEARGGDVYENDDALSEGFNKSGARIAAICADDATLQARAADSAQALRSAGAKKIYLIGPSAAIPDASEEMFDVFVEPGLDAIVLLEQAYAAMGAGKR